MSNMCFSRRKQFNKVSDSVRNWKTKPSDSENLALYSLFKQAMFGDVNISEPSGIVEKAKWNAWTGRKGISKDDAKKQYIEMAEKLHSKYA
ncbi:Acyl-CoA-binding protein [Papilio xuthus]|uniref:Acyl-CoA-binding protein n=1 Tax=Papilio xuthus TaxID=66420 RepID=A0A194Q462_PAPXU|nr:Acyl-CoA-binding protein [Papilio xuthus]